MIVAAVLAGGIGKRFGGDTPKQYLEVGGKPIIIHTVKKFCENRRIDDVLVLCPEDWVDYTEDLMLKYLDHPERVTVLTGGAERNDTIMNAISYIEERFGLNADDILLTHDAVRPFVTQEIIDANIDAMAGGADAIDTVIPATDTIVQCFDGCYIDNVPDRKTLFQGQTPQTFNAAVFKDLYESLCDEEKSALTDAAKVFVIKGKRVGMVNGASTNIKVTYQSDIELAETLLK